MVHPMPSEVIGGRFLVMDALPYDSQHLRDPAANRDIWLCAESLDPDVFMMQPANKHVNATERR